MFILKYKKLFLGIAAITILSSIVIISLFRLNLGIEYTGGSLINFSTEPDIEEVLLKERLDAGFDSGYTLRASGESFALRTRTLTEEEKDGLIVLMTDGNPEQVTIEQFSTVGPTLGSELKSKAILAIVLVVIFITLYIAYAFRHVSAPVSSWKYGLVIMVSLLHDMLITIGVFSLLGRFAGVEVDSLFLSAVLVILGYSINDTVVVFDRIRENLKEVPEEERMEQFDTVVGNSLSQTMVRSINTSLTVVISLVIIYILTPASIQQFALALLIGMVSGAYSSIFIAAPLLTYFKKETVVEEKKTI